MPDLIARFKNCEPTLERASAITRTVSKSAMMSGVGTNTRNALSTHMNMVTKPSRTFTSAGIDALMSLKTGQRERFFSETVGEMYGMIKSMAPAARVAARAARGKRELDEVYQGAIPGTVGKVVEWPFKLLSAVDNWHADRVFHGEMYRLAFRQAAKEGIPTSKLFARATDIMNEQTSVVQRLADLEAKIAPLRSKLKELSPYDAKTLKRLEKEAIALRKSSFVQDAAEAANKTVFTLRQEYPDATGNMVPGSMDAMIDAIDGWAKRSVLIDAIFPFRRTPANVVRETLRGSPLGAVWAVRNAMRYQAAGMPREYIQGRLADDMGQALIGTAMMYSALRLVESGYIRANPYRKAAPAERATEEAAGSLPDTLQVGDWSIPIARLEPFGSYLLQAAEVADMIKRGEKPSDEKLTLIGTMTQQLALQSVSETFLDPFTEFADAVQDEKGLEKWARSIGGRFVPRAVTQFDQRVKENVEAGPAPVSGFVQQVPGVAETKLGLFGEERKTQAFFPSLLFGRTGKIGNDPIAQEMARVGAFHLPPAGLDSKTQTALGITPDEDRTHRKALGRVQKTLVTQLVQDPRWAQVPDVQKKELIDAQWKRASQAVNKRVRALKQAKMPLTERNILGGL